MSPILIPITALIMVGVTAIGVPLARAFARRVERGDHSNQAEVLARLDRMERAIDSIAVEVERISEAERFTAKLLAERAGESSAVAPLRERR